MRFQRLVQAALLSLFLVLLGLAAYPLPPWPEVDLFLRLDPLVSVGTMLAARDPVPGVAWGLVFLGAALILGRIFCGYVCPMGITLDFVQGLGVRPRHGNTGADRGHRGWKVLFLAFLLGASLVGIASVFLGSPLSLITRFYSFVVWPLALMLSNLLLDLVRPLLPHLGLGALSHAHMDVPRFDTHLFVAALFAAVFALEWVKPRFWCRYVCPSGALQGLFSRRPLFRRTVSESCTLCGQCFLHCPTGAVGEDFKTTAHAECVVCLKCREICPVEAIHFRARVGSKEDGSGVDLPRRKVVAAALGGAAAAALTMTQIRYLGGATEPRGVRASLLIRPPGARTEGDFQSRCLRCGECVKACLTNTLQPVWFEAGLSGIWTPRMTPRLAGCEQNCNVCGQVCPTGAIRPLPLAEKMFAKVGTARIIRSLCIAWEQDRRCLICDEICPYNAISSRFEPGHPVTVPFIDEQRCNGCGYCENKCPVPGEAAVVVDPLGEFRMDQGSYRTRAKKLGLLLHAKETVKEDTMMGHPARDGALIRGEAPSRLPPGFIPKNQP